MNKLKTLKDCNILLDVTPAFCKRVDGVVAVKILRQEAIKWIKEIYKCPRNENIKSKNTTTHGITCGGEICIDTSWIKHFFNITEKELEDRK